MFFVLLILLAFAIVLEGSITTVPLILICLLCMTIIRRDWSVFIAAFVAGIFLDVFTLRQIGGTSIFFLTFLFLILLYQRKYEIYSYPFVIVASFIGSALFLSVFGYGNVLLLSGVSVIAAFLLFAFVRLFTRFEDNRKHSTLHYSS